MQAMGKKAGRGFTLIELLVVIAVIAILAGLLLPVLGVVRRNARESTVRAFIKSIETACAAYEFDYGFYPPDGTDTVLTIKNPNMSITSTESLIYHLTSPFRIIGTTGTPLTAAAPGPNAKGERWASKDTGPYMDIPENHRKDLDANGYSEVTDLWGRDLQYDNIRDGTLSTGLPGDPRGGAGKNLQGFDMWSQGEPTSGTPRPIANFKTP